MLEGGPDDNPKSPDAVAAAMNFVRTMRLMHVVGNSRLAPNIPLHTPSLLTPADDDRRLEDLLDLLLNIQSFAQTSLAPQVCSHWLPESPFYKLQLKLDEYAMQHHEDVHLTQQKLQQHLDAGHIALIHCAFLWHTCVLILNRVFLPIRCGGDNGASRAGLATYPNAPAHFLSEKRNVCDAAASTISSICHEVVIMETLFPACSPLTLMSLASANLRPDRHHRLQLLSKLINTL